MTDQRSSCSRKVLVAVVDFQFLVGQVQAGKELVFFENEISHYGLVERGQDPARAAFKRRTKKKIGSNAAPRSPS